MISYPSLICGEHQLQTISSFFLGIFLKWYWCCNNLRKMAIIVFLITDSAPSRSFMLVPLDFNNFFLVATWNDIFDSELSVSSLVKNFVHWILGIYDCILFLFTIIIVIVKVKVLLIVAWVILNRLWGLLFVIKVETSLACSDLHRNNTCLLKKFESLWCQIFFFLFLRCFLFSVVLKPNQVFLI